MDPLESGGSGINDADYDPPHQQRARQFAAMTGRRFEKSMAVGNPPNSKKLQRDRQSRRDKRRLRQGRAR